MCFKLWRLSSKLTNMKKSNEEPETCFRKLNTHLGNFWKKKQSKNKTKLAARIWTRWTKIRPKIKTKSARCWYHKLHDEVCFYCWHQQKQFSLCKICTSHVTRLLTLLIISFQRNSLKLKLQTRCGLHNHHFKVSEFLMMATKIWGTSESIVFLLFKLGATWCLQLKQLYPSPFRNTLLEVSTSTFRLIFRKRVLLRLVAMVILIKKSPKSSMWK